MDYIRLFSSVAVYVVHALACLSADFGLRSGCFVLGSEVFDPMTSDPVTPRGDAVTG